MQCLLFLAPPPPLSITNFNSKSALFHFRSAARCWPLFPVCCHREGPRKAVQFLLILEICVFLSCGFTGIVFNTEHTRQSLAGNNPGVAKSPCAGTFIWLDTAGMRWPGGALRGECGPGLSLVATGQQEQGGRALVYQCLPECSNKGQDVPFMKQFGNYKVENPLGLRS